MVGRSGFFKYIKKAFVHHWNLLALAAGTALGVISGHPDVVLPLVAAGEVVYLAGLSTHSRFQSAVDAEEHKAARLQRDSRSAQKAEAILKGLNDADRTRFEKLRALCNQLRLISHGVKGRSEPEAGLVDDMQMGSINRLLWIYLKLLYSKSALEQFFETIDENEIVKSIDKAKQRLGKMGEATEDEKPDRTKRRKSLQDTLATSQARLDNYRRAQSNHEFIELELDRLYSKIAGLGEMGINRQDPNSISTEVDAVSASVEQTEKAMGELEFLTGLTAQDEEAPELLGDESSTDLLES
jgi:hypothetical protein